MMARHSNVELSPAKLVDNGSSSGGIVVDSSRQQRASGFNLPAILRFLGTRKSPPKQSSIIAAQESKDEEAFDGVSEHDVPLEDGDEGQDSEEDIEQSRSTRELRSRSIVVTSPATKAPKSSMKKNTKSVGRPRKDKHPPAPRPLSRASKDIYDVPSGEEQGAQEEDTHIRKPTKRARLNIKPKHPLTRPYVIVPDTNLQSNGRIRTSHPKNETAVSLGGDVRADRTYTSFTKSRVISNIEHRPNEEHSEDDEPGELELYDNPSPVKIASPLRKPVHPQQRIRPSRAVNGPRTANNAPTPVPNDASESGQSRHISPTRSDSSFTGPLSAELEVIQTMIDCAGRVGHRKNDDGDWIFDSYAKRVAEKIFSVEGKVLKRRLTKLDEAYAALRVATNETLTPDDEASTSDDETLTPAQLEIRASINRVKSIIAKIVDKKLSTPGALELEPTRRILSDIYFNLAPSLIQTVKIATQARNNLKSITDPNIQEIVDLFNLLYSLSDTAVQQPKELQPEVPDDEPYQLEEPLNHILPVIQEVQGMFLHTLQETKQEEEKRKQVAKEADRKRRAKIRAEHLAMRRNDPTWGRLIRVEEAKIDARQRPKSIALADRPKSKAFQIGDSHNGNNEEQEANEDMLEYAVDDEEDANYQAIQDEQDDDSDDPFAGELERPKVAEEADEGVERIEIFPRDNVRGSSRVWSPKERHEFISIMMKEERGHDRYQDAADQLDATLPDIHDLAKELQDLMDRLHSNGEMNTPADNWTYHIWDPKNGQ